MGEEYFDLLVYIAKEKGLFNTLKSSTSKIANEMKVSQQTISRKLRDMEDLGLIKREVTPNGLSISIADGGRAVLKKNYLELEEIFKEKKLVLKGIIEKGIGEGKYYMSMKQYQQQFKSKLGFDAYPGTLNLKVNKVEVMGFLSSLEPVIIEGFTTKSRTYGSLTCYKIKINGIGGAIVIPERTRHEEETLEIIAPVHLRSKLNLKDGTVLRVKS
ncbi:CTP-dependent riboflavin kinase [Candidatus Woesearchaeota archaeon]|nr:CTP-dependent riboflavin kinase [Candidatus Woesearchaeota archaeon]